MSNQDQFEQNNTEEITRDDLETWFKESLGDEEGEKLFNYIVLGALNNTDVKLILEGLISSEDFRNSAMSMFTGDMRDMFKTYAARGFTDRGIVFGERNYSTFIQSIKMNSMFEKTRQLLSKAKRNERKTYPDAVQKFVRSEPDPEVRLKNALEMTTNFMKIFRANPQAFIEDLAMKHSAGAFEVENQGVKEKKLSVQDHTLRTLLTTIRTPVSLLHYLDPKNPIFVEYNTLLNENFVKALLNITLDQGKGFTLDSENTDPNFENLGVKLLHEKLWNPEAFAYPFLDHLDLTPRPDQQRRKYDPKLAIDVVEDQDMN